MNLAGKPRKNEKQAYEELIKKLKKESAETHAAFKKFEKLKKENAQSTTKE